MASFLPKRLSELKDDSDFDNTPDKNPLNKATKSGLFLPKRLADLSPLNSESEDEDGNRDDNLNCAILNDSFVLSPTKDVETSDTPLRPSANSQYFLESKENDRNKLNQNPAERNDTTSDLLSKFTSLQLQSTADKPKIAQSVLSSNDYMPSKSRQQLFTKNILQDVRSDLKGVPSVFQKSRESLKKLHPQQNGLDEIIDTRPPKSIQEKPISPKPLQVQDPKSIVADTPLKNNDSVLFVTPQVKSFRVPSLKSQGYQITNLLNSATQKHKQSVEKELRPQKILFTTTPIATSRPPVANSLTNSSISLSLDDTPVKNKPKISSTSAPIKHKLSPINERLTSKKSSESLFPSNQNGSSDETNSPENDKAILVINNVRYVVKDKLGAGGSSSVFLAQNKATKMECAIKLVNLDADPAVIEGYLNETKLLAKLQGSPTVVALYDYLHVPSKSLLYMVMEKGDSDLHKILQSFKSDIPLYTLMSYWYQILQSVNYIHQNGVIHSDLKPANFLMVNGRLKLIDFGIASNIAVDSTSIIKCSQAGTFNYISPEALIDTSSESGPSEGNYQPKIKISTKSDVWSLGCILYLFLYKKTPFSHIKSLYNKVALITNPNTEIDYGKLPMYYPPMLLEMLKKCLRHNPKERLSVAQLLEYPFDMVIQIEK